MHKFIAYYAKSPLKVIVLNLLKKKPMSGIDIINEIEKATLGAWRPSPGAIYPLLRVLEKEGIVVHEERKGKKIYKLTEKGLQEASDIAFMFPPLDVGDVIDILQSYVDYLKDYVAVHGGLNENERKKVKILISSLQSLVEV
ncbi:MAG: hypothetical protein DRJ35_03705 [Thermoprotei archaeon]|nr:MAG: hypothetical protein DRJ35_03705 [Thermoprotei archaeon]